MDPIREAHLSEPGLLVIDVAGRDDATVFALQGRDRPPVGHLNRRAHHPGRWTWSTRTHVLSRTEPQHAKSLATPLDSLRRALEPARTTGTGTTRYPQSRLRYRLHTQPLGSSRTPQPEACVEVPCEIGLSLYLPLDLLAVCTTRGRRAPYGSVGQRAPG
ncbi:DUF6207 family protein [Streptomyces albogriseolus]|uniref:DUF6207 family protein n=1 Tax=Streptomyces albogriseolus TaxID=1887 RepID=UPI0034609AD7